MKGKAGQQLKGLEAAQEKGKSGCDRSISVPGTYFNLYL
jgi:hypothetical protein